MIRLRVSDLDQWVRYVEPEREEFEVSTEQFLATMRREAPPSDDMRAGTAFHSLLEHANEGDEFGCNGIEKDGFTFTFDCDFALALPDEREPEVVERTVETPSGLVLLRGRVDGHDRFGTITDYKLSSSFDAERYATSLQWRSYLWMCEARRFRYLVFQSKRKGADVWIHEVHPLVFWAYPEMEADVRRRVAELAEFVALHVPTLVDAEEAPA